MEPAVPPPPPPPPGTLAQITAPDACAQLPLGPVQIRGTASAPNLLGWVLQITGGASSTWTTIASGKDPVVDGALATLNAGALGRPCGYTVRLVVRTSEETFAETLRTFTAAVVGDANIDGSVRFDDVTAVVSNLPATP